MVTIELVGGPADGSLRVLEGETFPRGITMYVAPEGLVSALSGEHTEDTVEMPALRRAVYYRRNGTRMYEFDGIH